VSNGKLRVAVIGVSHWHLELYLPALLRAPDVLVAGVSDADPGIAQHIAAEIGCPWSADFRDLCFDIRPDLVFAFGRHCDMAAEGAFLAREGIPFVMEKPCGIDAAEVRGLAKLVAERALFAAVPFVWRQSGLVRLIQDLMVGEPLTYLSFRLIAGPPSRYPAAGCAWMLDPKQSGGGCTINLACHFIDLFRALNGGHEKVDVSAAVMANAAFRLPVEDYSVLVLSSDDRRCLIETGYLYPAVSALFDMRFSLRADPHYIVATDAETVEVSDLSGSRKVVSALTTNVPHYAPFVADVLARFRAGDAPIANLNDMLAVMHVLDRAYELAGFRSPA